MKKKTDKKGLGCLVIFGGIFLLAGIGAFLMQAAPLYHSLLANDWQPVNAKIISVKQTSSNSSEGGTTYGVKGSFSYQYEGRSYTSSKLNFSSGTDNIGDYQKDFYQRLRSAQRNDRSVTAYVNPNNPSEAVIDKGIRWGMLGFGSIFLLVFGGAGGGIIFAGFWGQRKNKEEEKLQAEFQDKPWLWRAEWQQEFFTANSKGSYIAIAIFAAFWNLISFPIAILALPDIIKKGEYVGLFVLLFPMVGIFMAGWAIALYRRHKRYGGIKLYVDDQRIKIGDINGGHFQLPPLRLDNSEAIISLKSIHKYESGSGEDRSTREKILWEDTQRVDIFSSESRFEFNVPSSLKETDASNSRSQYLWRISIDSKQKGPDLKLDFEVPAFKLSKEEQLEKEMDETDLFSADFSQSFSSRVSERGDWTKIGVIQSYSNQGVEYLFPRMNTLLWSIMSLIGWVFVAVGIGVYMHGAPVLFPIIFGLLGGLFGVLGMRSALFKSRVYVDGSNLYYQIGHITFGETKSIPKENIRKFDTISLTSSGNTKYYNILVHTNDGRKHTIAKNLKVKGDIESFIAKLKDELNITEL